LRGLQVAMLRNHLSRRVGWRVSVTRRLRTELDYKYIVRQDQYIKCKTGWEFSERNERLEDGDGEKGIDAD
jgi:hypothetical protein